jgi:HPt (histidine-containing phosphotransfer) domain-containing protein
LFAAESGKLMRRMTDAIRNEDSSGLQRAAHTLRGSVRIFGAERAAAAALRLETIGADKKLVGAEDAWAALAREVERLMPMLAELAKS